MSDMLDDILTKNFINLALNEDSLFPQLKVPGQNRLSRSASFFSPSSQPPSSSLSSSSEHVNEDDNGSSIWSSNIWSQASVPNKKQFSFRPDRSMSLTEPSSSLLPSIGHLKGLDPFPPSLATTVAPPPGFPPSSNLPTQLPPMVSSNRYKTELCRGFQESGTCKYGSKCQFAHGEAELRGLYRHPKYKTEPCRTFYNFGYCPYGSRCHFIHEEKISGGPLSSAKFQQQQNHSVSGGHNPRHQLRQSVSFAGFMGPSRSSSPPSFPALFNDPNLGFTRAPSVSPPPADLLSPVFGDTMQRETSAFQFGTQQTRTSTGDIPLILETKPTRCVCSHGNNIDSNKTRAFTSTEDKDRGMLFPGLGSSGGFTRPAGLQRFSSEDSLEDSYSSSSSSGTESPIFDGLAIKRLTVFERLSLSD